MVQTAAVFTPPKRPSIHEAFPDFKIEKIAQDDFNKIFRVECRVCFRDGSANWKRPKALVAGGRGVRLWISEHEHELSLDQAIAQWIASPRNRMAKSKLSAYCRLAGWSHQPGTPRAVDFLRQKAGSDDIAEQAVALADAVAEVSA